MCSVHFTYALKVHELTYSTPSVSIAMYHIMTFCSVMAHLHHSGLIRLSHSILVWDVCTMKLPKDAFLEMNAS